MRRHLQALTSLALLAALAGGCGSSSSSSSDNGIASKSPEEIVSAAKTAAKGAATVHMAGAIVKEAKPISIDLDLVAGKGASGSLTLEGSPIEIVAVEHALYIKGSTAFYTHIAGPAAAQLLQGKWIKAPEGAGNFSSFAQLTELGKLLDSTLASHGTLAKGSSVTVEGEPAVTVNDTTKGATLFVASTGTPFPLEITKSGSGSGKITFTRWNQPVTLTAPANAININQLQSGH